MKAAKTLIPLAVIAVVLGYIGWWGITLIKGNREIKREESNREFQRQANESLEPSRRQLEDAQSKLWETCKALQDEGKALTAACQDALNNPPPGVE